MDPLKEYTYLAMLIALLVGGGYVYHKIEVAGEQKVLAAQAAADAKAEAQVRQVQNAAAVSIAAINQQLSDVLAHPVVRTFPVRVCPNPGPATGAARDSAAPAQGSNAAGGPGSGVAGDSQASGGSVDPAGADIGPATENLLNRLGAKIAYLQSYVQVCQQAGLCQKEAK